MAKDFIHNLSDPYSLLLIHRGGAALFLGFRACECEAKKSMKAQRKKSVKEKKTNSCFFLLLKLEAQFQSPKMLGRGKSNGLE
jgi:hypothetical protein